MNHDLMPPLSEKQRVVRPFHRLQDLRIEAECLADTCPKYEVYAQHVGHKVRGPAVHEMAFEHMIISPLRPLTSGAGLSSLRVCIPQRELYSESHWHHGYHADFYSIAVELGAECDRYELQGYTPSSLVDMAMPRAARHIIFSNPVGEGQDSLVASEMMETFDAILSQFLDWIGPELALPESMLWKIGDSDATTGSIVNMYEYAGATINHFDDDVPMTCRQAAFRGFQLMIEKQRSRVLYDAAIDDDGYEYEFEDGENDDDEDFHPRMR
jgi:hypothetical protein